MDFSQKPAIGQPYDPTTPFVDTNTVISISQRYLHISIYCRIFTIISAQTSIGIGQQGIGKKKCDMHSGKMFSHKKSYFACRTIDAAGDSHIKQMKPDSDKYAFLIWDSWVVQAHMYR